MSLCFLLRSPLGFIYGITHQKKKKIASGISTGLNLASSQQWRVGQKQFFTIEHYLGPYILKNVYQLHLM